LATVDANASGDGRMVLKKRYMKCGCGGRREAFCEKKLNYISNL
jgi:hypothetical protein